MRGFSFFKEFLKNWRSVSSITPSSRFLVKKMLQKIDFSKTGTIIEIGAGSGVFTKELLKKMRPDSKLIVLETNGLFCNNLKKITDPRLTVYNDSALNLKNYSVQNSIDYIISGIPLANITNQDKENILSSSFNSLSSGGLFVQFQYSKESEKKLKEIFDEVTVGFTPLNIPPAFVFYCLKK